MKSFNSTATGKALIYSLLDTSKPHVHLSSPCRESSFNPTPLSYRGSQ